MWGRSSRTTASREPHFPALGRVMKQDLFHKKNTHLLMCFEDKMMGFTNMIHSGTKDCIVSYCAEGKHCPPCCCFCSFAQCIMIQSNVHCVKQIYMLA